MKSFLLNDFENACKNNDIIDLKLIIHDIVLLKKEKNIIKFMTLFALEN